MDIFDVFTDRRSIRKYQDRPVEDHKISLALEAARLAPSWKNMQCWRFLVVDDPECRQEVASTIPEGNPGKRALATAPVLIVVCADPAESGVENGIEYYVADTAIAFEHFCLAAHALGLGTCWMGWYDEQVIKDLLQIPEDIRVVGITPLGYPDQSPNARPRKPISDIVRRNRWQRTNLPQEESTGA